MAKIIITGGAGYIGSHAVWAMAEKGHEIIILDNLYRGYKQAVETLEKQFPNKITFIKADLTDKADIDKVFEENKVDGVMHFGALCLVSEAVSDPYKYFQNNVYGTANLLESMKQHDVKNIIFSSTCSVYKATEDGHVDEDSIVEPESPYGESKYLAEREIIWYEKSFGFNAVRFRYFNVCGAQSDGMIGDSKKPSQLLVQNAVRGALGIEPFQLTYGEVDTPDGSPIRDYINVEDLADVHVLAMEKILEGENISGLYNIGTGEGNSVKEMVEKVKEVTGKEFPVEKGESRKGEMSKVYADISKVKDTLGWQPKRTIEDSITSLVKWYTNHPNGWDE